jgi:hypothetical protein
MRYAVFTVVAALVLVVPLGARPDAPPVGAFRPIANFNVPVVVPPGGGNVQVGSAEIVAATPDGNTLVYSDAVLQRLGRVDITNPAKPTQTASIVLSPLTPTSVAVLPNGTHAVVAAQPGQLLLVQLQPFGVVSTLAIGSGPDSVAVTRIGNALVAVVAIENEGALPAGAVEVIALNLGNFPASTRKVVCFLPGPGCDVDGSAAFLAAGPLAPDDPQPEFVAILGTRVAVTLQENNVIAVLGIANPAAPIVQDIFNAGVAGDRPADLQFDNRISFSDVYPGDVTGVPTAGARVSDAIAWSADGSTLFTADEGEADFEGGRGWSAHAAGGGLLYDDGGTLEATAVTLGHYLDERSVAKGIEIEGMATAEYGPREFLFASSERGSFVAVYTLDHHNRAHFVQLLPAGPRPEGILPLPGRNLLVTANEGSGGSISIFRGVAGPWIPPLDRPTIFSGGVDEPWSALSGLASDPLIPNLLYSIPDNALPSSLFAIFNLGPFARIFNIAPVTLNGEPRQYDFEGIAIDTSVRAAKHRRTFWAASEGDAATTSNLLVQVNLGGQVLEEIELPASVDSAPYNVNGKITSNGLEGVAVSGDGKYLLAAVQRPYRGEAAVGGTLYTRIARYSLVTDTWEAFFYPLEPQPANDNPNIGLSEITLVGKTPAGADIYAVIERDNRETARALLKRVYTFTLAGLAGVDIAQPAVSGVSVNSTIAKTLLLDAAAAFAPYEKKVSRAPRRATDGSCSTTTAVSQHRR